MSLTPELRELYQEYILDHGRKPRNFRALEHPTHTAEGYNPLCGDRFTVFARVEDGVIVDVGFQGAGCAISMASASTMTEALKGKTIERAGEMFTQFHALATGEDKDADFETLGKLAVFGGVAEFPMRVKCATLAWHTLNGALEGADDAVTTE